MKRFKEKLLLLSILFLAATMRFIGVDWDQGQHLHPDERFLTMVGTAMQIPTSIAQYLDPALSPMNPANSNFSFYVYGLFPVAFNKIIAVLFDADSYHGFTIQGRMLSAFIDVVAVIFVYKITELFEKRHSIRDASIKYIAAFLYAIAVLPIQLSHFFAVDTFLNTFLLASFYFALRYWSSGSIRNFFISIMMFSLALASKINGILMLPLIGGFLATGLFMREGGEWVKKKHQYYFVTKKKLLFACVYTVIGLAVGYFILRFSNPYLFESKNLFDPTISKLFLQNLQTLKSWDNPDVWFPPGVQWISKPPITFALFNLALFGVGLPYFVFIIIGTSAVFRDKKLQPLAVTLLWVIIFFLYQSTQFVKNMRYFIILYPFLAIAAAVGLHLFFKHMNMWLRIIIIVALLVWPLSFISIYTRLQSRIQASEWIYQNIPTGSKLVYEHWDDPLPLGLPNYNVPQQYQGQELQVFDADSPQKWQLINERLAAADYYILSSNRAWGSITTVPQKYPLGSKFYNDLFNEKLGFTKIKEVTSYPSLRYLGIPIDIPDDSAEESFTVYDHPKVIIFKRIDK